MQQDLFGIDNKTIVVWFSCGAASAVAAKETICRYGDSNTIRIVNNPVIEEHEDNTRFLKDVEAWLGYPIETAINPKYPNCSAREVWEKRRYMSGVAGAPCTMELKKAARQHWENTNHHDYLVLGFTVEEQKRYDNFKQSERDNILPVLIDAGYTKEDCLKILVSEGITPPEIYSLGYPNANCIGCVKASSSTYWNLVRKTYPDIFADRAKQSREIGAKLAYYKGKRIFLDELPEDAVGRPIKNLVIECGIFCEEI